MTTETPVNAVSSFCSIGNHLLKHAYRQGHSFANTAEDYEDREEWAKAAEAHAMAASQFQRAIQYAQDSMVCLLSY